MWGCGRACVLTVLFYYAIPGIANIDMFTKHQQGRVSFDHCGPSWATVVGYGAGFVKTSDDEWQRQRKSRFHLRDGNELQCVPHKRDEMAPRRSEQPVQAGFGVVGQWTDLAYGGRFGDLPVQTIYVYKTKEFSDKKIRRICRSSSKLNVLQIRNKKLH